MTLPNLEFGLFRLEQNEVYTLEHKRIELPEQALQVLKIFLFHALKHGTASLSTATLQQKAWAGRAVERNNVHQQIRILRTAFGKEAIRSTSGPRGYAFMLPVHGAGGRPPLRWHSLSVTPFVPPPGYFQDEARLRLAGYHLALGLVQQLQERTTLEIRGVSPDQLMPGWQPQVKQIASFQNSELVLCGTLTTGAKGDAVRVQLIEAASLNVLWTDQFTVSVADSLAFEQTVTAQLAERIDCHRPTSSTRQIRQPHPAAVASYRKGRYLYLTRHDILKEAFDEFSYAVSIDPNYAEPWAGLADVWILRCTYGLTEFAPNEGMPKALAAVNRALEIDPQSSDALVARGLIATFWEWNWEIAERHFKLALQYAPEHFVAAMQIARLYSFRRQFPASLQYAEQSMQGCRNIPLGVALGAWMFYFAEEHEKARLLCQEALAKEPRQPNALTILGFIQEVTEQWDDAVTTCQQAIESGETLLSLATLGVVYARLGQRANAEQVLQQFAERRKTQYISPYHSALVLAALGRTEEAFHQLERAIEDRSEWIPHSVVDYRLRELHAHPRFQALVQPFGLHCKETVKT